MIIKRKKKVVIFIVLLVTAVCLILLANYGVKKKIENEITNLPEHVKLVVKEISVHVLAGNITFEKVHLTLRGNTTHTVNVEVRLDHVFLKDLSYWDILFNNKITIDHLKLDHPVINYKHNKPIKNTDYAKSTGSSDFKLLMIKHLEISKGEIDVFNKANDSLLLRIKQFNLEVNDLNNEVSKHQKMPINFSDYSLDVHSVFFNATIYETLQVDSFQLSNESATVKSLVFKTKYSKQELSKRIKKERDHYDLTLDSLVFKGLELGNRNDSIFDFKCKKTTVFKPKLNIYRDKLVDDDLKEKKLYSKALRDLNFNLTLDNLDVVNAEIAYEEKVNQDTKAGKVTFKALHSKMENVSNTYTENTKTIINTDALFMGHTPIKTHWEFDVNNTNDYFVFKGELGKLIASEMNQFTAPKLLVRFKGNLNKTYFTIDGNNDTSRIDLEINYNQFDFVIIKENGTEEKKLLSKIARLFVSDNSKEAADNFENGHKETVERDKTKSVFNYLWINLKAGLIDAML